EDAVHDVGGAALGGVHGGGVPELDVLRDVLRRQPDPKVRLKVPGVEAAVHSDAGDGPAVAVLDPIGDAGAQATVVVSGQDDVADGGPVPVGQLDLGSGDGAAKASCAGGPVQSCDEIAGGRQHQALAAFRPFGLPGSQDLAEAGVHVSAVHAVVVEIEPER